MVSHRKPICPTDAIGIRRSAIDGDGLGILGDPDEEIPIEGKMEISVQRVLQEQLAFDNVAG